MPLLDLARNKSQILSDDMTTELACLGSKRELEGPADRLPSHLPRCGEQPVRDWRTRTHRNGLEACCSRKLTDASLGV